MKKIIKSQVLVSNGEWWRKKKITKKNNRLPEKGETLNFNLLKYKMLELYLELIQNFVFYVPFSKILNALMSNHSKPF